MSEEKDKGKKPITEKYPPMSPEDVRKEEERIRKGKAKYSMEQSEVEKALTEYLELVDPLVWEGKAIALIRRPTMKQIKELIPEEMAKYADNPKGVPQEIAKKYEKHFYAKMAELIKVPEYTAEEWENKANPWFTRLFWEHINQIALMLEGQIEGF